MDESLVLQYLCGIMRPDPLWCASYSIGVLNVQNSNQTKMAILCICLFSKTLFASDIRPFHPSAPPRTSGLIFPGLKPSSGTVPTVPRPGSNPPRTVNPDFGEGLGHGRAPKISGTFGTPEAELLKGNTSKAKASCIQNAIQGGEIIANFDDSSVWEFATATSPKSSRAPTALQSKLLSSAHTPAAFAKKDACNNDIQHSACVALLSKATTEVSQAYYNSALKTDKSAWDEVLSFLGLMPLDGDNDKHMNVVDALKKAQDKTNKETGESSSIDLSPIEDQDPLLVATQLLIQRIDESLARGDREGADKAKSILKKINPSAAYAASCVLGSVKLGGLNDDLDPSGRPQGSYFGPLSGIDYGKQDELKTHGLSVAAIGIIVGSTLTIMGLITTCVHNASDSDSKDKAAAATHEATVVADKSRINKEINDFMGCKLGGEACGKLFPDGAKAVKNATENTSENKGTSGPERPKENAPDGMFAPSLPQKPIPGSGGNGGESVPFDPTPSGSDLSDKSKKDHDFDKHIDPEASERFCQKTVNDYKVFAIKKVTGAGRPIEGLPSTSDNPIPFGAFGVAQFDKWTPAYWAEQKKNRESDPEYLAKQNNCHAMDEAQGL